MGDMRWTRKDEVRGEQGSPPWRPRWCPRGKRSKQKGIRGQGDGRERRVMGAEWVQRAKGVEAP